MSDAMPNIHVRDLPPEAVAALKEAARRRGRSLNAEIVAALVERAERDARAADLDRRLEGVRRRWRARNPEGFPAGLEPETIIRETRDTR